MDDRTSLVSKAFQTFMAEAPAHQQVWAQAVMGLGKASALDAKTSALAYLAMQAVLRLDSGIPFHVTLARDAGATREEVISAILLGLPLAGNAVIQALPVALTAYDST